MGISRVPGERAKIGLKTNDEKSDPIGACVLVREALGLKRL